LYDGKSSPVHEKKISPLDDATPSTSSPSPETKSTGNSNHKTSQRFLFFDGDYSTSLRKNCKANGTTIASALIVIALGAIRSTFATVLKERNIRMPSSQGWIVTSSMRHLLPNSKLLEGSDKQEDPSLMTFGGYGGSISDPKLRVVEGTKFWKQCRSVRRTIGKQFFPSMRKMKLMNWVHRHPRIWKYLEKKADLEAVTRTYSVELANLGAWNNPCANSSAHEDDERVRSSWFCGSLNNSFLGARALFSLGVVTLDNDLSITIAYNCATITEEQADDFAAMFKSALNIILSQDSKDIKIGELYK
jgi:hypothetical protein